MRYSILARALPVFLALSLLACSNRSDTASGRTPSPPPTHTAATSSPAPGQPTASPSPDSASPTAAASPTRVPLPAIDGATLGSLKQVASAQLQNAQYLAWQGTDAVYAASRARLVSLTTSGDMRDVFSPANGESILALSSNGLIATGSEDQRTLTVRDTGGKPVATLEMPGQFGSIAFSPSGDRIVMGRLDRIAADIWDTRSGKLVKELTGFQTAAPVYSVSFSPDGTHIVWVSRAIVQLTDIASGSMGPQFRHEDFVSGLALDAGDSRLYTGSDEKVSVFDANNGSLLSTLPQSGIVTDLALLLDGRGLLVLTMQGLSAWDIAGGRQTGSLSLAARSFSLSPAGGSIATLDDNGVSILQPAR